MTAATDTATAHPLDVRHTAVSLPPRYAWSAWHLHVDSLVPARLDELVTALPVEVTGLDPADWFFVRYWQGGSHLRVRVADLDNAGAQVLGRALDEAVARVNAVIPASERPDPEQYRARVATAAALGEAGVALDVGALSAPGVYAEAYEPETARYGGAAHLADAEYLFARSSQVALQACRARADHRGHLGDALEATAAAVSAWPGDRVDLLRAVGAGWSRWLAPGQTPTAREAYETGVDATVHRCGSAAAAVAALMAGAPSRWQDWTDPLGRSCRYWVEDLGPDQARQIFSSHLHMTMNRLGLGGGRDGFVADVVARLAKS